jgi:hypothetical protein
VQLPKFSYNCLLSNNSDNQDKTPVRRSRLCLVINTVTAQIFNFQRALLPWWYNLLALFINYKIFLNNIPHVLILIFIILFFVLHFSNMTAFSDVRACAHTHTQPNCWYCTYDNFIVNHLE